MSMQPRPWPDVPELTARMALSSSRQGNLAMRIRDELGEVLARLHTVPGIDEVVVLSTCKTLLVYSAARRGASRAAARL